MFSLTLKGLWAHKLRYALTGLAVVLGVAFMVGTLVLTDTMEQTFDGVFESANEGTDVIVRRDGAIEDGIATARDRLDAGIVDRVADLEGVAAARGSIQGVTQLVQADGTTSPTEGFGITVGANWIDDERLNPFSLSSGRAPGAADEAVIDESTAGDQGWALGDRIQVLARAGSTELTIVGIATYGDLGGVPGSSLVATTDATAQTLFAEPGRYDRVLVAGTAGVTPADLIDRIGASVATPGSGLEVLTGTQDTADQRADLQDDLAFLDQFLMAFAYVALLVGTFIIYNTFSIVVAQRTKDVAMLRAVGARRAQVLRSVVLESVLVGAVSAAVGLAAGVGLSFGLRALLAGGGLELPDGPLVVSSATITTALGIGVVVSVLSAVVPAVRASRVRPIAALREVAVERSGPSVGRVAAGVLLAGAGAGAFATGLSASGQDGLPLIGLGATAAILGFFTLGPVLVGPVVRLLGVPTRLLGVTGRYARENARRNPRRTAATASALMVGVALVGFITIFAASTKDSIAVAIDESFRADYVVDSGSVAQGFAPAIEDELRAVPGVALLSPVRVAQARVDGSTTHVMGLDPMVVDELYDMKVTSGSITEVRDGGVAVTADKARDEGLSIGDPVPVRFADGQELPMTVRAVFDGHAIGGEATWIVDLDTFEAHVPDQFDRRVFVALAPGVTAAESRAALEVALAGWPNAELQDGAQFREGITAQIDAMLNLIYGLLALTVVISLIGIANTLALSVHERTRELGLLRAVGMQRRQIRRAVRWESLLIAVLGTALGAVLAVGAAWGVVRALEDQGITRLTLPPTQLAVVLGMAGVAAVLAAAGPARRAAKLDVLEAIATG
ncbi:MAG: FtsX-like permease family protein [Acidimicrobiia bacterium]|nr:FtsX-like permease family protein [Acidimicrobiia bacterium]